MTDYLSANWDEVLGTLFGLIYILFSILGRKELWIFGLLNSALYILVLYRAGFYADLTLQVYYVGVSIYGLWHWIRGAQEAHTTEMPISRIGWQQALVLVVATAVCWGSYSLWLIHTNDPYPLADAFTSALCVVGTWMLARKQLENWLLFIVADGLSVGLYVEKHIYFAAGLMALYTVLAIVGYFRWKKEAACSVLQS